MEIFIIAILIVAAVILFLVEIFLIPGVSIAGIAASGALIYANYYAFTAVGNTAGFITLVVSAIAIIGSIILFMRSKTLEKVSLKENITSKVDRSAEHSIQVGDKGVSVTRLALMGNAEINGKIVEVKSNDGFLDEKVPVVVVRINDGIISVEQDNQ